MAPKWLIETYTLQNQLYNLAPKWLIEKYTLQNQLDNLAPKWLIEKYTLQNQLDNLAPKWLIETYTLQNQLYNLAPKWLIEKYTLQNQLDNLAPKWLIEKYTHKNQDICSFYEPTSNILRWILFYHSLNYLINWASTTCYLVKLSGISFSIKIHWAHDVGATLNQRHWRWFNVATT